MDSGRSLSQSSGSGQSSSYQSSNSLIRNALAVLRPANQGIKLARDVMGVYSLKRTIPDTLTSFKKVLPFSQEKSPLRTLMADLPLTSIVEAEWSRYQRRPKGEKAWGALSKNINETIVNTKKAIILLQGLLVKLDEIPSHLSQDRREQVQAVLEFLNDINSRISSVSPRFLQKLQLTHQNLAEYNAALTQAVNWLTDLEKKNIPSQIEQRIRQLSIFSDALQSSLIASQQIFHFTFLRKMLPTSIFAVNFVNKYELEDYWSHRFTPSELSELSGGYLRHLYWIPLVYAACSLGRAGKDMFRFSYSEAQSDLSYLQEQLARLYGQELQNSVSRAIQSYSQSPYWQRSSLSGRASIYHLLTNPASGLNDQLENMVMNAAIKTYQDIFVQFAKRITPLVLPILGLMLVLGSAVGSKFTPAFISELLAVFSESVSLLNSNLMLPFAFFAVAVAPRASRESIIGLFSLIHLWPASFDIYRTDTARICFSRFEQFSGNLQFNSLYRNIVYKLGIRNFENNSSCNAVFLPEYQYIGPFLYLFQLAIWKHLVTNYIVSPLASSYAQYKAHQYLERNPEVIRSLIESNIEKYLLNPGEKNNLVDDDPELRETAIQLAKMMNEIGKEMGYSLNAPNLISKPQPLTDGARRVGQVIDSIVGVVASGADKASSFAMSRYNSWNQAAPASQSVVASSSAPRP